MAKRPLVRVTTGDTTAIIGGTIIIGGTTTVTDRSGPPSKALACTGRPRLGTADSAQRVLGGVEAAGSAAEAP